MASNFPSSLDSFTDPLSNSPLNNPSHAGQHQDLNNSVEQLEVKMGVGASAATSATSGQVLTANGSGGSSWQEPAVTAAQFATVGLVYVTHTTVGTGVSSIVVSNCFSSTMENYRVVWVGGYGSNNGTALRCTVSGATGSNYNYGGYYAEYSTGILGGSGSAGQTSWVIGEVSTVALSVIIEFYRPQVSSAYTQIVAQVTGHQYGRTMHGHDTSASSSTGFTIVPGAGTLTGGTVTVFGYKKG